MKYNYTFDKNNYETPPSIVQKALQLVNSRTNKITNKFELDVCCSTTNIPASNYFNVKDVNGLAQNWSKLNWCNCPFNECQLWVRKAYSEQLKGNTSILLLPVRTGTKYWQEYILTNKLIDKNKDIIWLKKGIRFINPDTKTVLGVFKNDLALVLFKGEQ